MTKSLFSVIVLILSHISFNGIPDEVSAENAITTCSKGGLGLVPCSTYSFLYGWRDLQALGGLDKDEATKAIRCKQKDTMNYDDAVYPRNCGVFSR